MFPSPSQTWGACSKNSLIMLNLLSQSLIFCLCQAQFLLHNSYSVQLRGHRFVGWQFDFQSLGNVFNNQDDRSSTQSNQKHDECCETTVEAKRLATVIGAYLVFSLVTFQDLFQGAQFPHFLKIMVDDTQVGRVLLQSKSIGLIVVLGRW